MKLRAIDSLSKNLAVSEDMAFGIVTVECCCQEFSEKFLQDFKDELSRLTADIQKFKILFSVSGTSAEFLNYLKDLRIEGKEITLIGYCSVGEVGEDESGYAKINLDFIAKNNIQIEFFDENNFALNEEQTLLQKSDVLMIIAWLNYDFGYYYKFAKENLKPLYYVFPMYDEYVKEGEKLAQLEEQEKKQMRRKNRK